MNIKSIMDKYSNNLIIVLKIYINKIRTDVTERNRFLMLSLSLLFFIDYFLFCYISSKNPFNIFPSIPLIKNNKIINVFIPETDGKNILKENRDIAIPDDREGYIKLLFQKVLKGSNVENTSIAVPVDFFIRKIWFFENMCIIDVISSLLDDKSKIIPGSERIFIESLEETITDNIPEIKKVILIEKGIYGRNMWEQQY